MDSSLLVGSDGIVVDAGRSRRTFALLGALAVAVAVAVAIAMLVQQASPASAQISIGAIVCPILRSLAAAFGGFLAGIFNSLLAAFGC